MLHEFLDENREELAERCGRKRDSRAPVAREPDEGIPLFIGQLIDTLRAELTATTAGEHELPKDIAAGASLNASVLMKNGFSVGQVVHHYGDLCQALTELAQEKKAPITIEEFHTFNRCLDNAIAEAVTEFGRQRDRVVSAAGSLTMNERLGGVVHELRNLLNSAMLAFQAIESGNVALSGATGGVLRRSLMGLRDSIDRSLADVRLNAGAQVRREPISIGGLIDEVQIAAEMEAEARGVRLVIDPVETGLAVDGDRAMLTGAIANILQNAFKFTRTAGKVTLRVHADEARVHIDVEDECGGLASDKPEDLFQPFHQRSGDRSGLGLGLSISRGGVQANGGTLGARDIPGVGCVFTIDLPRETLPPAPVPEPEPLDEPTAPTTH